MVNFYSTGHGNDSYRLEANDSMRGQVYFKFKSEPKNIELWSKKVNQAFSEYFLNIRLRVETYKGKHHGWADSETFFQATIWF